MNADLHRGQKMRSDQIPSDFGFRRSRVVVVAAAVVVATTSDQFVVDETWTQKGIINLTNVNVKNIIVSYT